MQELKDAFHDDVAVPFEQIKSLRKISSSGPSVLSRAQCIQFLETMKAAMEKREYENAVKTLGQFESLAKGQVAADDAADVIDEMRALSKQAEVMIEFLALKLKTTGLIIRPQGGSTVILNGKARKAGDYVDAANRCRLKEIHEHHLLLELDGFEIEHALDSK
jgi:hypothetical protein